MKLSLLTSTSITDQITTNILISTYVMVCTEVSRLQMTLSQYRGDRCKEYGAKRYISLLSHWPSYTEI